LLFRILDFVAGLEFSCKSNELLLLVLDKAVLNKILSLRIDLVVLLSDVRVQFFASSSISHGLLEGVLHDLLQEDVEVSLELGSLL